MELKDLLLGALVVVPLAAAANPVVVKMNSVSTKLTLSDLRTGSGIEIPAPANNEYAFELEPGNYRLTGLTKDSIVNGDIDICVKDSTTVQQFTVLTCTAYVSNKTAEGAAWSIENGDYTLNVSVNTREGEPVRQTPGKSATAGRYTFLALNGNSYNAAFEPSDAHKAEGYMTLYRGGTLTANVNVSGAIPPGGPFSIKVPADAELQLGIKFTHFTDFTPVTPDAIEESDGGKIYKYTLAHGQIYNYRTWKPGGLTHGGYFTMNTTDEAKRPIINFTEADYAKADPKAINHSPQSNNGYETGDLLLNINPRHHLRLKAGEEFLVHGMRMWELSDNSTNNYFFEPDFHYSVFDTDFKPSEGVIEIENADTETSAWSKIKAKGRGTAIVTVTYDGINLNYYNNADRREYLGGEYWGAIWPENTGVFVVTVDDEESAVKPNMTVNEEYNMDALRLAGNDIDAEHDVFYYLDTEEGFSLSFTPEGVEKVEMAAPALTETAAVYSGFSEEGVTANEDGSYTLLLKEGRTIVKMTDAAGRAVYQVVRAKPCHREITNETRPGSLIFQPGDQVKIQYSGLYHPANKIAGIYNMSAYVTYNGVPNGSSLILGSGQYTFGSAASAQAVSVEIPADYDLNMHPEWVMDTGVIQVNGYGDPIGNHRNTSPTAGRSPNFTAVPHKTYFGTLPDIRIRLTPVRYFSITLADVPEEASLSLTVNGEEIKADEDGVYTGTFGTYSIVANADGYKCFRRSYTIGDDSDDNVVFHVEMDYLGNAWDGETKTEPQTDEEGAYLISSGAELAWFAEYVNTNGGTQNAMLVNDIELGNFSWSPIGNNSKNYTGIFSGAGHTVSELYIDETTNYKGLFGYAKDAKISGITVSGSVAGKQYVGGLAGYVTGNSEIDRCANYCTVSGTSTYVGGLTGYLNSATAVMTNCYNAGHISGTTNCGGVVGSNNASATITNIFNVGAVEGKTVGSCVGGTTAKTKVTNAFTTLQYHIVEGQTLVSARQMASGEVAFLLGESFFQTIGEDEWPGFTGLRVYFDDADDEYYNKAVSFEIDRGEGDDAVTVEEEVVLMHVKDCYHLGVIATPGGARLPEITWSSSDEEVVTVSHDGKLTALAEGEAIITARAAGNDAESAVSEGEAVTGNELTASCKIRVSGHPVSVDTLFEEAGIGSVDVYDINGCMIRLDAAPAFCKTLAPGLYVVRYGRKAEVVIVR